MKLNEKQQEAVDNNDRFVFLLAGAGTGKTRVIIEKLKTILKKNTKRSGILAITFTRKAAQEMRSRLGSDIIQIKTFHKFFYDCLKEIHKDLKFFKNDKKYSQKDLLTISNYKQNRTKYKTRLIRNYQECLKIEGRIDFDDLEIMFNAHIQSQKYYYDYILIDEFQDTSNIQYQILKGLITKNTKVFLVGDPDQSVYAFRGANVGVIKRFINDYQATVIKLSHNYRSSEKIISCANRLIKKNKIRIKKSLISTINGDGNVHVKFFVNDICESKYVIEEIRRLNRGGIKLREIAILGRNNRDLKAVFNELSNTIINVDDINIMTIHKSKGLEFEVVFIVGLNRFVFPTTKENTKQELEEERRLMFVAITRAKNHLYLSSSNPNNISRFITETIKK